MTDNLPKNLSDVEDEYIVGTDIQGFELTHYVLAERLMQVEAWRIYDEYKQGDHSTLTYILEGGFRGFHKMSSGELWSQWKDGAEVKWYELHNDLELPWESYEEDPIHKVGKRTLSQKLQDELEPIDE